MFVRFCPCRILKRCRNWIDGEGQNRPVTRGVWNLDVRFEVFKVIIEDFKNQNKVYECKMGEIGWKCTNWLPF